MIVRQQEPFSLRLKICSTKECIVRWIDLEVVGVVRLDGFSRPGFLGSRCGVLPCFYFLKAYIFCHIGRQIWAGMEGPIGVYIRISNSSIIHRNFDVLGLKICKMRWIWVPKSWVFSAPWVSWIDIQTGLGHVVAALGSLQYSDDWAIDLDLSILENHCE